MYYVAEEICNKRLYRTRSIIQLNIILCMNIMHNKTEKFHGERRNRANYPNIS